MEILFYKPRSVRVCFLLFGSGLSGSGKQVSFNNSSVINGLSKKSKEVIARSVRDMAISSFEARSRGLLRYFVTSFLVMTGERLLNSPGSV